MFAFFERRLDPFPIAEPHQPPDTLFAFCKFFTRGSEPWLIFMASLTAVMAISEAMLFGFLGSIVDWLALQKQENFIEEMWPFLLMMTVFVLLVIPSLESIRSLVIHQTLMGNFPMRVRWLMHRYLLSQSYAYFQNEFSGRIATKVMQTALAVRDVVMKILDVLLFILVYLITTTFLIASADPMLCIPLFIWLVLFIVIQRIFVPRLRKISTRQADARSLMTGRIVDSYTNILTVKVFSDNNRESMYVKSGMGEFLSTVHPQMRLVTLLNITMWSLNVLLIFSTSALGITLWLDDMVSPGAIAVVIGLAIRLTGMSHWIMWEIANLFENLGVVQDGINSFSVPNEVFDQIDAQKLEVSDCVIDFKKVHFAYNNRATEHGSPVFRGLNLRIESGEKVGVVGRSGAGKSTLVNLLMRFYDIQSGEITIDGKNIAEVQQNSLRGKIALVSQDTSLLHRSVRENILFSRPKASEEEMIDAALRAEAHEFILELQDSAGRRGYDAHVGERGVTLSGGQRQRIAIARVLLKDAPILILDEATSALDSEVEAAIKLSFDRLMQGKTVIAIAHRLSTIAAMDRLIVFDRGEIVEEGCHKDLLALNRIYAKLWRHQSGGFLGFD